MDREAARQYIKDHLEDYLESEWGINTRKPFRCLNPDHNDHKPSMSIDRSSRSGIHCKCFSCGAYYDTFDLIGIKYGLTDPSEIFNKAYEVFQIDRGGAYQKQPKSGRSERDPAPSKPNFDEPEDTYTLDLTNEAEAAHAELLQTPAALTYLQERGLTAKTVTEYKIGFDRLGYNHFLQAHPEHQTKGKKQDLYRYVYPYPDGAGRFNYALLEIIDRTQTDRYNAKYRKISGGETKLKAPIFNERYLQDPPEAVFVCEGIFDALSAEEAGAKAIAFVGTADHRFLGLCQKYRPQTTFIIALDNDGAGQTAAQRVKEGLDALEIPYIISEAAGTAKDFNEALQNDRGAFMEAIARDIERAENKATEDAAATLEEYQKTAAAAALDAFRADIETSKTAPVYPTGFDDLDEILDGGLYAGLYIVGAISSLGKTTFCLQIADQIAAAGNDVLIFSLEMARNELIAKSVSRLTYRTMIETGGTTRNAKTTRGIMTGRFYSKYYPEELELINQSIERYGEYAEHIYIFEGIGNIGETDIRRKVEEHIEITGHRPAVLIDYLQIIAPYDTKLTDKQNTDKNVLELKRLSRDCNVPIIGISSFNRNSYTDPVNMAAFKESGAIEYSSDVLIGLQYEGMDYDDKTPRTTKDGKTVTGETDATRQKRIRKLIRDMEARAKNGEAQRIQVKILKNRNGSKGSVALDFFAMFNCFEAVPISNESEDEGWTKVESTYSTGKKRRKSAAKPEEIDMEDEDADLLP